MDPLKTSVSALCALTQAEWAPFSRQPSTLDHILNYAKCVVNVVVLK